MSIIQKIIKSFNKISAHWAANYPKAWSLGWFTQLVLGGILYSLTFIVALLIPMELTETPEVTVWYGLGYIPATFWGIFIIYRLIKYNSEKLFGNRNWWHNFIEIPTYILQFIMPLLIPIILGAVLTVRIGGLIEDQPFHESKIAYEEAQPFFSIDFGSGSYLYRDYEDTYYNQYSNLYAMFRYHKNDADYYHYIVDDIEDHYDQYLYQGVNNTLNGRDSIDQYRMIMRDSIGGHKGVFKFERPQLYPYQFYEFSIYNDQFISKYFYSKEYYVADSLKQIYFHKHHKNIPFVEEKLSAMVEDMQQFGEDMEQGLSAEELLYLYEHHVYSARGNKKLSNQIKVFDGLVTNYRRQLNYIQECKNRDFMFLNESSFYLGLFTFIFGLALVLALFKNMSWVEFLVGLFVVVLIPILSGIFMVIMSWNEEAVIFTFWGLFVLLFIWGIVEQQGGMRRKRGAALLMVPHLLLAFFPIALLGTLDELFNFWHWSYFDSYLIPAPRSYDPSNMEYNYDYETMKSASVSFMMLLGYALYLFVLYPVWLKVGWINYLAKPKKS